MPNVILPKLCCHVSDAEASNVIIHKKVGEDVELSYFPEGHTYSVKWLYNGYVVAEYIRNEVYYFEQFTGRLYLNITNFSLKLKHLNVHDSGTFAFLSVIQVNPPLQRPTVFMTLHVHGKTLLSSSTKPNKLQFSP